MTTSARFHAIACAEYARRRRQMLDALAPVPNEWRGDETEIIIATQADVQAADRERTAFMDACREEARRCGWFDGLRQCRRSINRDKLLDFLERNPDRWLTLREIVSALGCADVTVNLLMKPFIENAQVEYKRPTHGRPSQYRWVGSVIWEA